MSCSRVRWGIKMRELGAILAINGVLLGILALIWAVWNSRRPMTAGRLRKVLHWERLPASAELPCRGDLGAAAALLRAAGQGGDDRALLAAVLTRWEREGRIALTVAPKKRLRSFGEDEQAELRVLECSLRLPAAEAGLFDMIAGWTPDGTLQRSELYGAARADSAEVCSRVTQLRQSGVRALREMGGAFEEGKTAKFGFSREAREIYTTKGVRLARGLAGFRKYAADAGRLTGAAAEMAVLTGVPQAAGPAAALADALAAALLDGAQAGGHIQQPEQRI